MSSNAGAILVLCASVHHGNTARVARVIVDVLGGTIATPEEVPAARLLDAALVGFGSGVYYGRFHESLRRRLAACPDAPAVRRPAFVFSTAGLPCLWRIWHAPFTRMLRRKGFAVLGEFHCGGHDSWGPLGLVGGLNRAHPDIHDFERAAAFAHRLEEAWGLFLSCRHCQARPAPVASGSHPNRDGRDA